MIHLPPSATPAFIRKLADRLGARLVETHISWVLVGKEYAWKIKKPINLGFLDFSTLERRRFCCQEEVRLNRRLAPHLYLSVEPVTEAGIGGAGPALDWAVKMRAFDADATLDHAARVGPEQIDAIADRVARFHDQAAWAPADGPYGSPEAAWYPVGENFRQIAELAPQAPQLAELEKWCRDQYRRLTDHFAARRAQGWVRECHGDLHLGNIAWVELPPEAGGGIGPLIFDCIEFNPALRYIDVISEVAFLCMDLASRGLSPLAWRFLNRWLEHSGDYAGLAALPYYQVYRALVRAKVNFIRASQENGHARDEARRYLGLAERLSRPSRPALLLMHGVSGAGKSWLAEQVLETLGAVRLRSDVERKRLFGLQPLDDSSRVPGGIYTEAAGQRTFDHLRQLAGQLLDLGLPVIVDATFLRQAHRQPFLDLARERGVARRILDVQAEPDLLRQRVAARAQRRDDPSEAGLEVLEAQLREREPLTEDEAALALGFRAEAAAQWPDRLATLKNVLFPAAGPAQ